MSSMNLSVPRVSPWRVYAALAVFSLALLGALGYVLHTGSTVGTKHVPLVQASEEIKLDATLAHLWFEEILSGDNFSANILGLRWTMDF